jgi:hypothetical protein
VIERLEHPHRPPPQGGEDYVRNRTDTAGPPTAAHRIRCWPPLQRSARRIALPFAARQLARSKPLVTVMRSQLQCRSDIAGAITPTVARSPLRSKPTLCTAPSNNCYANIGVSQAPVPLVGALGVTKRGASRVWSALHPPPDSQPPPCSMSLSASSSSWQHLHGKPAIVADYTAVHLNRPRPSITSVQLVNLHSTKFRPSSTTR